MKIPDEISAIEAQYEAIPQQLSGLIHRLRCLRRTGKAGNDNLRRIRRLELDLLELLDIFKHQERL